MKVKCPTCKKIEEYTNNPFRPFCSERCKLIDLGAWASESFSIPTDEKPDFESLNSDENAFPEESKS